MDRNYFKEYYSFERNHWWFKVRMKLIEWVFSNKINPSGKIKILKIGAGTGGTSQMLEKIGEVTSVEYDSDCCKFLFEMLGINALNVSVTDLPFGDSTFDVICCFDVLEHVEDDNKAI